MDALGQAGEMGAVMIVVMVLFQIVKKIAFVKKNPLLFLTGFSLAGVVLVDYQGGFAGPVTGQVAADWIVKGFIQALAAAKLYERYLEDKKLPGAAACMAGLLAVAMLMPAGCALIGQDTDSVTEAYYRVKTANAAYNAAKEQLEAAAKAGEIDLDRWAFAETLSRGYVEAVDAASDAIAAHKQARTEESATAMNAALEAVEVQLGLFMGYVGPLLKE